jgi:hypothetical protein
VDPGPAPVFELDDVSPHLQSMPGNLGLATIKVDWFGGWHLCHQRNQWSYQHVL